MIEPINPQNHDVQGISEVAFLESPSYLQRAADLTNLAKELREQSKSPF